ncbi:Monosaccharide-sensing protein 2 [Castilleja foliolosa]|uniref:Monosaccharide-sensing protein 2 n=1 Tax=Castilleja foliolosa TaxID=1961234 RepID=A0ABD3BY43_9LAMI
MNGAVLVAIAATVGTFLQGWDNATIAGSVVYIKREMELGASIEGLIVAMSLIGATLVTTCSGTISDKIGRRPMLVMSSTFYFVGGLIMLWSPSVHVLLAARLLDGLGIGLAVTLVPLYISETAPSEIRGSLNTLPQFTSNSGSFLAYCMIFGMSLLPSPSWRLILGVISVPSLLYFLIAVFYLPESPRWLVSKGKMLEAKRVLQKLRGREDVSGEMALLVEGLKVGGETSIEEFIIAPSPAREPLDDDHELSAETQRIKLYGSEEGRSWIAKAVAGQSRLSIASRQASMISNQNMPLMNPLVTLFNSVHEKLPETGSTFFPNFGSMFSTAAPEPKTEEWDEESVQRDGNGGYTSDVAVGTDSDDNLRTPLISRQATSMEKDLIPHSHGTVLNMRRNSSLMQGNNENSTGIGGGWQLAWKWSGREGDDGMGEGEFKRVYLHQEGDVNADGEYVQAAALVSQPALWSKELTNQQPMGPAMMHPSSQNDSKGSGLAGLLEPGVKRALVVGIGIQMLQQFSGISGVLFYTPQILQQAGIGDVFSSLGLGSDSASFLISAFTNLLMLPSVAVAMRFIDEAGRRSLLLSTIPVLILSLVVAVIGNVFDFGQLAHSIISTACVVIYFCFFVMGYGPIPNLLCSEIFPTKVRGMCIAICALVFWISDVIVTYAMPVMLSSIGLAGVFGIFAVFCVISFIFVYLRVPETKGMPLEVITEFFAVGATQGDAAKRNE